MPEYRIYFLNKDGRIAGPPIPSLVRTIAPRSKFSNSAATTETSNCGMAVVSLSDGR